MGSAPNTSRRLRRLPRLGPGRAALHLVLDDEQGGRRPEVAMLNEGNGYFVACTDQAKAGNRYGFRIDRQEKNSSRTRPRGFSPRAPRDFRKSSIC